MAITVKRVLQGQLWNELVDAVEVCLLKMELFSPDARRTVIFDDARFNGLLRATVIRHQECFTVSPWAGPQKVADGFGYRRVFTDHTAEDIARSVRAQLAAAKCEGAPLECFGCGCTFDRREAQWLRFLPEPVDEAIPDIPCDVVGREVSGAVPLCAVCATTPW
jgi:hypothetical protein